jgi:hypothetical protein
MDLLVQEGKLVQAVPNNLVQAEPVEKLSVHIPKCGLPIVILRKAIEGVDSIVVVSKNRLVSSMLTAPYFAEDHFFEQLGIQLDMHGLQYLRRRR